MEIKPLPYYTQPDRIDVKAAALALRREVGQQVARRLSLHHITGFRHDTIVNHVAKWKKQYPYFLRTDIAKYYPNVRAVDLVTQTQIAHRDLYGLPFVSRAFKARYLPAMVAWMHALPVPVGIPLGSGMSSVLAALALVPMWLQLKKQFDVKFIVFMDDVLVLTKDEATAREVWKFLQLELDCTLHVHLNPAKTVSGRFATDTVEFCGWRFAGGYATVCPGKYAAFKERIAEVCKCSTKCNTRAFIKRINAKIDGFGHYYKHGAVLRQFGELDAFVRNAVRAWLCGHARHTSYTNSVLETMGLHTLVACYHKAHGGRMPQTKSPLPVGRFYQTKPAALDYGALNVLAQNSERMCAMLSQLVAAQRSTNRLLTL